MIELQKIYTRRNGRGDKNRRITADKSYDILNETSIHYDWYQQIVFVPKIK